MEWRTNLMERIQSLVHVIKRSMMVSFLSVMLQVYPPLFEGGSHLALWSGREAAMFSKGHEERRSLCKSIDTLRASMEIDLPSVS